MNCEYCKNSLKTLSSLNYHKKNNKQCLLLQKKLEVKIESALILCEFCSKNFSTSNINIHVKNCKKRKENNEKLLEKYTNDNKKLQLDNKKLQSDNKKLQLDNKKLQLDNKKLQLELNELKEKYIKLEAENNIYKKDHDTVTSIAKQPKTTNTYNNLSVYNDDVIKDRFTSAINNIKPSDLYDGQKSIGRFVAPCLQNDDGTKMITCSDFARNVFIVKDDEGNLNKDIKCRNLANIIEPIATAKVDELIKEDNDKRWKVNRLNILKKQLMNRETDIENLENHLLGLEKYSQKWCYVKEQIIQKEKENELDFEELEQLDEDNNNVVHHHHTHVINYDEKLAVAADDIKEMKKDSSKFSKTLSELV